MIMLLTDDEIVAVAVKLGVTWPYPLPTVERSAEGLLAARSRGGRSLMVRGLATIEEGALSIDKPACGLVSRATSADWHVISYVATDKRPESLAGTSTYLYLDADESAPVTLDLVSSSGIHDIRESSRADAFDLVLALIENAFLHGIRGPSNVVSSPVLFSSSTIQAENSQAIRVSQGVLAFGTFVVENGNSSFNEDFASAVWEPERVGIAIGRSTWSDSAGTGDDA
jgi:hypothetical protein